MGFLFGFTIIGLFVYECNRSTNKCEKLTISIWCSDSNSWPFEHETPPITTRPPAQPV